MPDPDAPLTVQFDEDPIAEADEPVEEAPSEAADPNATDGDTSIEEVAPEEPAIVAEAA